MKTIKQHIFEVQNIAQQIRGFAKSRSSKKLRFYHGGTNSTRKQNLEDYHLIDISCLDDVIEINTREKYALVEPNVSMDKLVDITLQYGFIPQVVMEFPGITVGGAINGGTLESSSYRYGQLSDTAIEYEIILGNGEILTVSSKKHPDLFYGISGTYGTLGLLTLIKLKLLPSSKYVHTTYIPTTSPTKNLNLLKEFMQVNDINYVEGILFDSTQSVVITGKLTNTTDLPVKTYSKATDPWFYERARQVARSEQKHEELIPVKDFMFRYNRGAFWMGEHVFSIVHIPNNKITRTLLNPFFNTRKLYDCLQALNLSQTFFIQDFYCPIDKTLDFIKFSDSKLSIYPIWLCPVKPTKTPQKMSPHYFNSSMLIDIGIWGRSKEYLKDEISINRKFENFAKQMNSRKMLYAHAYYSEEDFWSIYDKQWYSEMRDRYYAEAAFPDIWQKVHVTGIYKVNFWKGIGKILLDSMKGKHLNT